MNTRQNNHVHPQSKPVTIFRQPIAYILGTAVLLISTMCGRTLRQVVHHLEGERERKIHGDRKLVSQHRADSSWRVQQAVCELRSRWKERSGKSKRRSGVKCTERFCGAAWSRQRSCAQAAKRPQRVPVVWV